MPRRLQIRRALRLQRAPPGRRRRLLPEEHPRRTPTQRRRRVPVPALSRPNLDVRSRATSRAGHREGRVAWASSTSRRQREIVRAAREVILCGGVVESPRLLMLSGIGPPITFEAPRHRRRGRRAGVGQNFQDHLKAVDPLDRQDRRCLDRRSRAGTLHVAVGAVLLVAALSRPTCSSTSAEDSSSPIASSRSRCRWSRPKSRGEIRLRSTTRFGAAVHPRELSAGTGRRRRARARRRASWTATLGGLRRVRSDCAATRSEPGPGAKTDADLAHFVRRAADTIYHAVQARAAWGPRPIAPPWSTPAARARRAGLRVADASIMPEVVNATTHAACVMIGEKLAALVQR